MSAERRSKFSHEAKTLLRLGGPLIVNNLAVAGMQFADAVMAGRLGAQSLAGVAVGASFWFLGFSLVLGVMMAISPITARYYGAKQYDLVGRYTRQGIYLAIGFGIAITLVGNFFAEPLLTWFGIDDDFRAVTTDYVAAISWGGVGIFIFLALRFTTEGVGHTRPIMYTSIFALVMNVFLNWVLAFGNLGAPALGAVGLGYASAVTMWLVMLALLIYCMRSRVLKPMFSPRKSL